MSDPQIVPPRPRRRPTAFESVAIFAITASLLYLGAGILVPLTLSILLAFALNPVVSWLGRRLHLPDAVAVIVAVVLAIVTLGIFALTAGTQVAKLASDLPGYQDTISAKLMALQSNFSGLAWLTQINEAIANLGSRLTPHTVQPGQGVPIPVTISNEIGSLSLLTTVMGSIIGPVATVAIVAVFLIFLLLGRADLQDRFLRLVSAGRYSLTNMAISDASRRVGRYLIIQLMVNTAYGTIFGIGLWLIGVPSALLWGLLIILFRYIPFVGAMIIAVVPIVLAFAVDPGWNMLALTVGLFLLLDLTTANVIEPRLYGSSTGVSPIAILLSAMFWATLWGPIGLILSTPMTVCLVVIGRHLPQFQFLETLLGSEPVLSPSERLYQRMLNGDSEDAIEIAEDYIADHDQAGFIDKVMLPALRMANAELVGGAETVPQRRQLIGSFDEVINTAFAPKHPETPQILLIGGRSEIDEAAAKLLATQLLDEEIEVGVMPPGAIRQEAIGRLDLAPVSAVVLVFMGADVRAQCRYVARRIRRMDPAVQIAVCLLNDRATDETAATLYVDNVCHDFDAVHLFLAYQTKPEILQEVKPVRRPFAGAGRGDDALGHALDLMAEKFGVPAAMINLLDDQRHLEDTDAARLTLAVVDQKAPLVIHGHQPHSLVGESVYLQTNGIDLYAAAPLMLPDGQCVGVLALIDYEPRQFGDEEVVALVEAAKDIVKRFA